MLSISFSISVSKLKWVAMIQSQVCQYWILWEILMAIYCYINKQNPLILWSFRSKFVLNIDHIENISNLQKMSHAVNFWGTLISLSNSRICNTKWYFRKRTMDKNMCDKLSWNPIDWGNNKIKMLIRLYLFLGPDICIKYSSDGFV